MQYVCTHVCTYSENLLKIGAVHYELIIGL